MSRHTNSLHCKRGQHGPWDFGFPSVFLVLSSIFSRVVGLVYDPRMKEHRNEMDPWHPEVPDRISRIWEALCSMGYTDRCRVIQVSNAPVMSGLLWALGVCCCCGLQFEVYDDFLCLCSLEMLLKRRYDRFMSEFAGLVTFLSKLRLNSLFPLFLPPSRPPSREDHFKRMSSTPKLSPAELVYFAINYNSIYLHPVVSIQLLSFSN